jgi:hypothetical protein
VSTLEGLETERGNISNGVTIISDCALGSASYRPVKIYGLSLDSSSYNPLTH